MSARDERVASLVRQGIDVGRIVESLCSVLDVVAIYVFGSRARGDYREGSDLDLYVTTKNDSRTWAEQTVDARLALDWFEKPLDVIANSEAVFERRSSGTMMVEHYVKKDGVMLYESTDRP